MERDKIVSLKGWKWRGNGRCSICITDKVNIILSGEIYGQEKFLYDIYCKMKIIEL